MEKNLKIHMCVCIYIYIEREREREMYNRITLLYTRNEHNIVNQLYSNKEKKEEKKEAGGIGT